MAFRVLIVRLSQFRDVVKSTTHQFLYGECSRILPQEDIDFAFLPSENARRHHDQLSGYFTHMPASQFDLILIANSYAVELINLPYMLKIADIPYSSYERRQKNIRPIIILGGSNALASQAILFSEDEALVDAVYFGEGEQNVSAMVKELSEAPEQGRHAALVSLQDRIDGLRVFGAPHKEIKKAIYAGTAVEMLANADQALFDSAEAGTVRLMISYDCPSFCTFCFEGWERKPYREVPYDELIKAARHLKQETGAETLEITAFNFNTHTDITRIILEMNKLFAQVNFMSQRADILASNSSLAAFEVAAGKRQYTLGAEGISQRMRSYFNKNLDEQTLLASISLLMAQSAVKEIKLFYIISGLETDDDFDDFSQFLVKATELKTKYNSPARILCSFGLLVRMPFTPLRYERLILTKEEWEPVVQKTKEIVEGAGYEFRLTYPYDEYFLSQTLVLTKDYAAPALIAFAEKNMVYDQTLPEGAWKMYTDMFPVTSAFTSEKEPQYEFAYASVDTKTPADFLYARFLDTKTGKETKSCMGSECRGCGSCTVQQRHFLTDHMITMPCGADKTDITGLLLEKQRAKPVYITVTIPENMSHSCAETKDAFIMRNIMEEAQKQGIDGPASVMIAKDALFGSNVYSGKIPHWHGETVYAIYPFSNKSRHDLACALKEAGHTVYDDQYIPDSLSITFTSKDTADQKELEKISQKMLDSMHIPVILSRQDGYTNLSVPPKALKKHIINSCSIHDGAIHVTCTIKADFSAIAKEHLTAYISF